MEEQTPELVDQDFQFSVFVVPLFSIRRTRLDLFKTKDKVYKTCFSSTVGTSAAERNSRGPTSTTKYRLQRENRCDDGTYLQHRIEKS